MLRGTLAFVVLVVCALLGMEARRHLARRGLRAPALEGLAFLLVGWALGEDALGLFPTDALATLRAVVLIGLAWIGLVYGLQIDLRVMRQLRPWHRRLGLAAPLLLGGAVAGGGLLLGLTPPVAVGLAGVAMASSSSSLDGLARRRRPGHRPTLRLLRMVIAFSGIPALVFLAVAASGWGLLAADWDPPLAGWQLLVATVVLGAVVGYTLLSFLQGVRDDLRLLTVLTGGAGVLAGTAAVLGVSAMPSAALAGAIVMNRWVLPHRVLRVAHSLERPLLLAMLLLVGASWSVRSFSWTAFALLSGVRLLSLVGVGGVLARTARRRGIPGVPLGSGLGMAPQGELAIGLLVALDGLVGPFDGLLEAGVLALVANTLVGQYWLRRRLFGPSSAGSGS